jgi:hypothetical protein
MFGVVNSDLLTARKLVVEPQETAENSGTCAEAPWRLEKATAL